MLIVIVLGVMIAVALTFAIFRLRRRGAPRTPRRTFPPVVELARPSTLPRLGFKVESLTARPTSAPPAPPPAPPAVPFAMYSEQVSPSKAASPAHEKTFSPPPLPETPPNRQGSIFENPKTLPYATPVVTNHRISLPFGGNDDLPIEFSSAHPNATPIAEAGDHSDNVHLVHGDGRIHLGRSDSIVFGPTSD